MKNITPFTVRCFSISEVEDVMKLALKNGRIVSWHDGFIRGCMAYIKDCGHVGVHFSKDDCLQYSPVSFFQHDEKYKSFRIIDFDLLRIMDLLDIKKEKKVSDSALIDLLENKRKSLSEEIDRDMESLNKKKGVLNAITLAISKLKE